MGVTELRADEIGYRKEGIDTKIPSLRAVGDKKTKQKPPTKNQQPKIYERFFVFALSMGKELQCLLVL